MPFIVGLGGTTRQHSSSETAIRSVLSACAAAGAQTQLFGGLDLADLPHFAPEQPERTVSQQVFVEAVRRADGLVIATPGYHGGISGLVKNAIDLLEDLRTDDRPYFHGRAVGLIVTAAGWQAGGITLQSLRGVVHAMRGWPTPLGVTLNSAGGPIFDKDGRPIDPALDAQFTTMADQILTLAKLA